MNLFGAGKKSCRRCGRAFVSKPKAHGQRFCTEKCRALFYYRTVYYPRHVQSKKPRWHVRFCKNVKCGIRFSVSGRGRGQQHRKYCNDRCARAVWRRADYNRHQKKR